MPGLLRGIARTAVVAGTATAVSNRVSRRQAPRWAAGRLPRSSTPCLRPPPLLAGRRRRAARPAQGARRPEGQGVLTEGSSPSEKARILSS